MYEEFGPVWQDLVDLFESLGIVWRKFLPLPELRRQMGALDRLCVEV